MKLHGPFDVHDVHNNHVTYAQHKYMPLITAPRALDIRHNHLFNFCGDCDLDVTVMALAFRPGGCC